MRKLRGENASQLSQLRQTSPRILVKKTGGFFLASLEPLFNAVECHKKGELKKKDTPKTTKEINSKKFYRSIRTKTRKQVPKTPIAERRNSELHLIKFKTINVKGGSKCY